MPVILLSLWLALLVPAPAAAAAGWARPVDGGVVGAFRFRAGGDPYARGWRRGVDLRATSGDAVRAPCSGRVAYAGAVPGREQAVSLRCGRLTATVLGLARAVVRRGTVVLRGALLGRAAGRGVPVRLGARVTARRFGYIDPLALLGAGPRGPRPVLPLRGPRGRAPGRPAMRVPRVRVRVRVPVASARPAGAGAVAVRGGVPIAAWGGLVLATLGLGLPAVALPRRRRARAAIRREAFPASQ